MKNQTAVNLLTKQEPIHRITKWLKGSPGTNTYLVACGMEDHLLASNNIANVTCEKCLAKEIISSVEAQPKYRHENCDGAPDGGHSAECLADESPDQEAIDSMNDAKASYIPKSELMWCNRCEVEKPAIEFSYKDSEVCANCEITESECRYELGLEGL